MNAYSEKRNWNEGIHINNNYEAIEDVKERLIILGEMNTLVQTKNEHPGDFWSILE